MKKPGNFFTGLMIFGITLAMLFAGCEPLEGSLEKMREKASEKNSPGGTGKTYTVTFDGNYQTSGEPPAAMTATAGSTITIPSGGTLAKSGFDFDGWNTQPDGNGTAYQTNDAFTVDDNCTLFAQWSGIYYTVTFYKNNTDTGSIDASPPQKIVDPSAITIDSLPTDPERPGWTFVEWNTKSDRSGNVFTAATTINGNMSVYAIWQCSVTFKPNGGTGTEQTVTITTPTTTVGAANMPIAPTRTGNFFNDGWNLLANGKGDDFTGETIVSGNTQVYAKWTPGIAVTIFTDGTGSGTFRYALTYSQEGDTIRFIGVEPGVTTISLASTLSGFGTRNLTIEGNGITLKKTSPWIGNLMSVGGGNVKIVTISRVHFKGGSISKDSTGLILKSCIFSEAGGNAIHSSNGQIKRSLIIMGCTFYNNLPEDLTTYHDIIDHFRGDVYLLGNLFYEAAFVAPADLTNETSSDNLKSQGYNLANFAIEYWNRDEYYQWHPTDVYHNDRPSGSGSMGKIFSNVNTFSPNNTANVRIIPSLPDPIDDGYIITTFPTTDFYGNIRDFPGAPGAVR